MPVDRVVDAACYVIGADASHRVREERPAEPRQALADRVPNDESKRDHGDEEREYIALGHEPVDDRPGARATSRPAMSTAAPGPDIAVAELIPQTPCLTAER